MSPLIKSAKNMIPVVAANGIAKHGFFLWPVRHPSTETIMQQRPIKITNVKKLGVSLDPS